MLAADVQMWLGGGNSFFKAERLGKWVSEHPEGAAKYADKYADEDELLEQLVDAVYQTQDNVAVITVAGPLTNEDSFWNLIFGVTSYNTISAALNRAIEDDEITDIVLNLSTTGGDAEGIGSVAENIRVADGVKPVYAFSGTKALSAGYWIAAATRKIYGSPMSEWGSIGAIVTHVSRHRQLKEKGLDVAIFRGGKFKALGHPAEKLSDKAKKFYQEKVEKLYDFFLREISGERPSLKIEDKETWAEGRVFFAEDALRVGLIDSVTSFNDLISSLVMVEDENGGVASAPGTVGLNDGETAMKKIVLDPSALAKLASGVPLDQLEHKVEEEPTSSAAKADGSTGDAGLEDGDANGAADEGKADGDSSQAGLTEGASDVLSFYKEELKEARKELADLTTEKARLEAENTKLSSDVESLRTVAVEATERLQISLGQTPANMESLSAEAVAAQYNSAKKTFQERFKVGQVSASAEEADTSDVRAAARKIGLVPKAQ
jgi:signal peptide peptidase SppA